MSCVLAFILICLSCALVASIPLKVKPGSIVALVTPMTKTNAIDYNALGKLLDWHLAKGTDGAVILGTTGESTTISMEERTEIIKMSVKVLKGKIPIIVGTGTIDPNKVIELTQQAKDLGADASLIITPYYVKPPQRALVKHFTSIADKVALPIILYNCPGRTGVDMKPETIAECATHPMIIGVKDASGDLSRVKTFRDLCPKDFLLFSGEDDQGCEHVRTGGDGVISVTANIMPEAMHKMLAAAKSGNIKDAEAINAKLMLLHKRLFLESNPIPVKMALNIMGMIDLGIRPPLTTLANSQLDSLKEAMKEAGAM